MTDQNHAHEAERLLAQADTVRNAEHWSGDRDAASLALATMAQGHATLALVDHLQTGKVATYDVNAI